MAEGRWVEIMSWISANQLRPLVLLVLAQEHDTPIDEFNIARQAGAINQQMSGEVVETAVIVNQIRELESEGYVKLSDDGFRWELTDLGLLVSRQWAPGSYEPREQGPLGFDAIRAWRDRVVAALDADADAASAAGIERGEWLMTQTQRLVEMHVLNRVLGEEKAPDWLVRGSFDSDPPPVDGRPE